MSESKRANYAQLAERLLLEGVVVVPLYETEEALSAIHESFVDVLNTFPEYKNPHFTVEAKPQDNTRYVRGEFGALGNPASFHNLAVRQIRADFNELAVRLVYQELDRLFRDKNLYRTYDVGGYTLGVEGWLGAGNDEDEPPERRQRYMFQEFDRMSVRPQGTKIKAESWHRDPSPGEDTDSALAGILNLDLERDQWFSCVKYSHKPFCDGAAGFAALGTDEIEAEIKEIAEDYPNDKAAARMRIPPGHVCVFFKNILHEIAQVEYETNSLRQYLCVLLTHSPYPRVFVDYGYDVEDMIAQQATMKLPSLQQPPMWNRPNHLVKDQGRQTEEWSVSTFQPVCIHDVSVSYVQALPDWAQVADRKRSSGVALDAKSFAATHPIEVVEVKGKRVKIPKQRQIPGGSKTEVKTVTERRIVYHVVDHVMTSLAEYKLPMYREYSEHELSILKPAHYHPSAEESNGSGSGAGSGLGLGLGGAGASAIAPAAAASTLVEEGAEYESTPATPTPSDISKARARAAAEKASKKKKKTTAKPRTKVKSESKREKPSSAGTSSKEAKRADAAASASTSAGASARAGSSAGAGVKRKRQNDKSEAGEPSAKRARTAQHTPAGDETESDIDLAETVGQEQSQGDQSEEDAEEEATFFKTPPAGAGAVASSAAPSFSWRSVVRPRARQGAASAAESASVSPAATPTPSVVQRFATMPSLSARSRQGSEEEPILISDDEEDEQADQAPMDTSDDT
jgi:hypothetical protein